MRTSYFAKIGRGDRTAVAISISCPSFFSGRHYPRLAPPYRLLADYRKGDLTKQEYEDIYRRTVLALLDPTQVVRELGDDATLVCWEGPGKFCHRHIVAAWLRQAGIDVREETV